MNIEIGFSAKRLEEPIPETVQSELDRDSTLGPLLDAILEDDLEFIKKLSTEERDIGSKYICRKTPYRVLHYVVVHGSAEAISIIADNTSSLDLRTVHRRTSLHLAAEKGNIDAVHILIFGGANIDAEDSKEMTPLLLSSDNAMSSLLIKYGADVNTCAGNLFFPDFVMSARDSYFVRNHLRSMVFAGMKVHPRVKEYFDLNVMPENFELEAQTLRAVSVNEKKKYNLYDCLFLNDLEIYKICDTEVLRKVYEDDLETIYPRLGSLLYCKLERAIRHKRWEERAREAFEYLTCKAMFQTILEKIKCKLSKNDVENLIAACILI